MNGFYLIDKPIGITSFDVIRRLKKELKIKRIGHTGTLDPLATGLLLVASGNYTKLIPFLENDTKIYDFTISLDGVSDSFDLGTEVEKISKEKFNFFKEKILEEKIKKILEEKFSGKITQLPPKYSALKIGGKKALELVKSGVDFELKKREVEVFNIEVLEFSYPILKMRAKVSAGTYIRSIANDLGEMLGTGGYITELRRVNIGELDVKNAMILNEFKSENKVDINDLFLKNYFIFGNEGLRKRLDNGLVTNSKMNLEENKNYFIFDSENNITHVIKFKDNQIVPVRKI